MSERAESFLSDRAEPIAGGTENHPGSGGWVVHPDGSAWDAVPSGIQPLDERVGGLKPGGVNLFSGPPGPEKLVAILHFIHRGIMEEEKCLLISSLEACEVLDIARTWGLPLTEAWQDGRLQVLGFRDQFEMRVLESMDNADVMRELDSLAGRQISRIGVDPGSMFLQGGARTTLGHAFIHWAQNHEATLATTLSVDGGESLPPQSEWLLQAFDGVYQCERQSDGFLSLRVNQMVPGSLKHEDVITLQLVSGRGLTAPSDRNGRQDPDRITGDPNRILLIVLDPSTVGEMEGWVSGVFDAEVVSGAETGILKLKDDSLFGAVIVQASRRKIQEVPEICRAARPLTGGAIVVASNESTRSTDRAHILRAGADDCITGGVDFRELGARVRQAAATGGKALPPVSVIREPLLHLLAGSVSWEDFIRELAQRSTDPETSVFAVQRISALEGRGNHVVQYLERNIRLKGGDLVSGGSRECFVFLQGARREGAKVFLARVERGLQEVLGSPSIPPVQILAHPRDKRRIRRITKIHPEALEGTVNLMGPEWLWSRG